MEYFNNHKKLFLTALGLFLVLTTLVAILPAFHNQANNAPLPGTLPMTEMEAKGKRIYIGEGCVGCHTQQVRNLEMDKQFGSRPSVAADYATSTRVDFWRNSGTLMGTERTGPDLINIGNRQPSIDWQLLHLYQPRAVVKESIMPAYKWLFEYKEEPGPNDKVVNVPAEYMDGRKGKIVAKPEALQLVAYLLSLKQIPLPDGTPDPEFLYKRAQKAAGGEGGGGDELDGAVLYAATCQSCHQANGEGLIGAFPPLKGSKVVLDEDPEILVDIIMNGYTARRDQGYPAMPPIGTTSNLTPEEVTAIINHEKTSWGNNAKKVTVEQIKELMDAVKLK
ncbi:MAG: cbb3-type cytochrome c oxidase subunit II [Ginsengibacter sp.]